MANENLTLDFDNFSKKVKKLQYETTDKQLKKSAGRISLKLPQRASGETLSSFANYKYSNGGMSRNLKYKLATKKIYGGYKMSVHLGDDQPLAHLFENGFNLKQRYGYTRVGSIMNIDFENESKAVVDAVVNTMNNMKGG